MTLHFDSRSTARLLAIATLCFSASGCPASTTGTTGDTGAPDAGHDAATIGDDGAVTDGGSADAQTTDGGSDGGAVDASRGDSGPPTSWGACGQSSDCVLAQNDCCGWCGMGHFADVDAVNESHLAEHEMDVCPVPMPCPACASGPLDPQVIAVCQDATCHALDLGTMPTTECTVAADCEADYGNCCGCAGTDDEVIAVRRDAGRTAIDALFCMGGSCPLDCATRTPPGWGATCDAGRCMPVRLTP
jgi:hypothetical protein